MVRRSGTARPAIAHPVVLAATVAGWTVAAVAAVAVAYLARPAVTVEQLVLVTVLTAGGIAAERGRLHLPTAPREERGNGVNLSDLGVPLAILLLSPWLTAFVTLAINLASKLPSKQDHSAAGALRRTKATFNIAMATTVATLASSVLAAAGMTAVTPTGTGALLGLAALAVWEVGTAAATVAVIAAVSGRPVLRVGAAAYGPAVQLGMASITVTTLAGALLYRIHPLAWLLLSLPLVSLWQALRHMNDARWQLTTAKAERDMLEQAAAVVADAVALVDANGTVLVSSPLLSSWAGTTEDDAVGQPIDLLLTLTGDDGPVALADMLAATGPDDRRESCRVTLTDADGGERVVDATVVGQFVDGRIDAAVVVLHDITEEWELAAAKTAFVGRVSHELRTPLTPIVTYGQLLSSSASATMPADDRAGMARDIVERAKHMQRLIEDLLVATQVTAIGDVTDHLRREDVDLLAVTGQVTSDVALQYPSHRLHLDLAAGLPSAVGDHDRLRQVLTNLTTNACKYSPPGPVEVSVRHGTDGRLTIRVSDHGAGIPAAERERIFEQFHRVAGSATRAAGAGVGLYVARSLVEAMGGRLDLVDTGPHGSTFEVELAAGQPTASATASGELATAVA